jgi:hypothetical protein
MWRHGIDTGWRVCSRPSRHLQAAAKEGDNTSHCSNSTASLTAGETGNHLQQQTNTGTLCRKASIPQPLPSAKAGLLLTPHSALAQHSMACRAQRQGQFLPTGNAEHLTPLVAAQNHTHPRLHRFTHTTEAAQIHTPFRHPAGYTHTCTHKYTNTQTAFAVPNVSTTKTHS